MEAACDGSNAIATKSPQTGQALASALSHY
jgi:hypothetical protein